MDGKDHFGTSGGFHKPTCSDPTLVFADLSVFSGTPVKTVTGKGVEPSPNRIVMANMDPKGG